MSSWKKYLLYGGGATAVAMAIYGLTRGESQPRSPEFGGSFDQVFKKANEEALKRALEPQSDVGPSSNENKISRYAPPALDQDIVPILILYGTEYGFSAELAKKLEDEIQKLEGATKLFPRVISMEDFELVEWDKEQIVLVITSTYGDGVPPNRARNCFEFLLDNKRKTDLSLNHIQYALLALGDKSYLHFCRAGKTFDARLGELGAQKFSVTNYVDLEDWDVINRWFGAVNEKLPTLSVKETRDDYLIKKAGSGIQKKFRFERQTPFYATLVEKKLLTVLGEKEDKETIHFEFELPETGMEYIVGDSLGVIATNLDIEVDLVIKALGVQASYEIKSPSWKHQLPGNENAPDRMTLRQALVAYYDLKNPKPRLPQLLLKNAEKLAENDQIKKLKDLMKDGVNSNNKALNDYLKGREVGDVLNDFSSIKVGVEEFLDTLGQFLPRYYSISSSPSVNPRRVSITVAIVRYDLFGRGRVGVCSTYLADRVKVGDKIPIFVNNNPDFRLPSDPATPILMVGPGTGLAPFRAMLQERVKLNATGENVLYFGCRHSSRDYLYKEELEQLASENKVTLHTAFSRDQKEKVYVQQRVRESAAQVWKVLEAGGHIYICGDAQYMAGDVHSALTDVVSDYGKISKEDATKYLEELENQKRYQRDVWY